MASDGGRHRSDRPSSGDQYIFSEDRKGEGGVDCIAERIEYGRDIEVNSRGVVPDIRHWQGQVFREGAGTIDADALRVGAEMAAPGHAIATASAYDMAFAADDVARIEVVDVVSDGDHLSNEFVSHDHGDWNGGLSPVVPLVDVKVRTAYAGSVDANEDVVYADARLGHVLEGESALGLAFDKGFHSKLGFASLRLGILRKRWKPIGARLFYAYDITNAWDASFA